MKLTYAVIMYQGPNNWSAYCPDVLGTISAGKDQEHMRAMIREALELTIDSEAMDHSEIPWPKLETTQDALAAESAFMAEIDVEFPDDDRESPRQWRGPIAEMIDIEVALAPDGSYTPFPEGADNRPVTNPDEIPEDAEIARPVWYSLMRATGISEPY